MELGPVVYSKIRDESVSLKNRMSDLKRYLDLHPQMEIDGEKLQDLIVERAVSMLPAEPENEWDRQPRRTPSMDGFARALDLDGFTVTEGVLRRTLPTDIGLPATESELMRLLGTHRLDMPKGHLQQAIDAHARGNWAGANGQMRTFIEGLLDSLAERVAPGALGVPSGHARRTKLAAAGFLSVPLNEWGDNGSGFINGLMRRLHPEGPHPGLSDKDDSTFRLHVVLLTATLLLRRFDRGPGIPQENRTVPGRPW